MAQGEPEERAGFLHRFLHRLIGRPLDVKDTSLFRHLSLIPILAWIGLGADGLSSSSYGPEEAFRTLGSHTHLAVLLAFATAFTVFIISYAYSRIIEHFPHGGGGYIVATHTIGPRAGVVSGCALLVDYMLTITVSLASCADAIFSFLPVQLLPFKMPFAMLLILVLVMLNLRGVKESVQFLAPIFITFVVTHVLLLGYGLSSRLPEVHVVAGEFRTSFGADLKTMGGLAMLALLLRAFSLGGGTYTGIEAVSNGLQIMREPRVHTGKRTMLYMATSLAITAGGLFICYLLFRITPTEGKTLNAVLAGEVFHNWPLGYWLALITILSEGALLVVAAQAGFIDGPRVMANMAVDSWFPRRFAALSERLTMQNGILLMGVAAFLLLYHAHGSVSALVVMYSINVFLTFSLSQFGMTRFYVKNRDREAKWKQHIIVHIIGFVVCVTILTVTIYEKFSEGGWLTLVITGVVIAVCYLTKHHYLRVRQGARETRRCPGRYPRVRAGKHRAPRSLCHDGYPTGDRLQRLWPPYAPLHSAQLSQPLQELHFCLRGGDRFGVFQGCGRGGGPESVGEGRPREICEGDPQTRLSRRFSHGRRHRRGGGGDRGGRGDRPGIPPVHGLHGQACLPP